MKKILLALALTFPMAGCLDISPLSPELEQQLELQDSKINGLENNQNAIKLELGRTQNELGIQNSKVEEMQQGWVNLQAAWSRVENHGTQILQGDGALILVFASVVVVSMLVLYYKMDKYKKSAAILGQQVKMYDDYELTNKVLAAAYNTEVEKDVYKMIK